MTAKTPKIPSDSAEVAPAVAEPTNNAEDHPDPQLGFDDLVAALEGQSSDETDDFVDTGLDDDQDTSLVLSVMLHLVSEHHDAHALSLSDTMAMERHTHAHERDADHSCSDHRFRIGRALATLTATQDQQHTGEPAGEPDADGD